MLARSKRVIALHCACIIHCDEHPRTPALKLNLGLGSRLPSRLVSNADPIMGRWSFRKMVVPIYKCKL